MDEPDTRTHKAPTLHPGLYARKEIPASGKASKYSILHVIDRLSIDDLEKLALSRHLLRRKPFCCLSGHAHLVLLVLTGNIKWRFGLLTISNLLPLLSCFATAPSEMMPLFHIVSVLSRSPRRISIEKICKSLSNVNEKLGGNFSRSGTM